MANRIQGLDLVEPQVFAFYPDDPYFNWHGRTLLRRLTGATWIWITPTFEVQVADLSQLQLLPVARGGEIADDVRQNCFCFNAMPSADDMAGYHGTADRLGLVLGSPDVAPADAVPGGSQHTRHIPQTHARSCTHN